MAGLLGYENPFLRGMMGARHENQARAQNDIAQASGLLSLQNARMQQQQAQKDQQLRGLLGQKLAAGDMEGAKSLMVQYKPELLAKTLFQAPKWQATERFNESTGMPEKVLVDLNNPTRIVPFGGQKAPEMKVAPNNEVYNPFAVKPGQRFNDYNKNIVTGEDGRPMVNPLAVDAKRQIAAAGRPMVSVTNTGENAYAKALGGKAAEADLTQYDNAQIAADNLGKINMVIDQLEKGDVITGLGADIKKNFERARYLVTQSEKAGKKVSDTELMDSLLGSDVFPQIKALGIGARGLDTPAEREFLRQVMTGTINMNKDTLIRMAKIRKDIAERAVKRWNERVERGEVDRFFSQTGRKKEPFRLPSATQGSSDIFSRADAIVGG